MSDKIRICCMSDTHTLHDQVCIPECDLLLHAGDITGRGAAKQLKAFARWFDDQSNATHKVAIPGNHDHFCEDDPVNARRMFKKSHLIIDETIELLGLKIYGTPWSPWFYDWAFNLPRRDKGVGKIAEACWAQIPEDTDILLVHGPPHKILDKVDHCFLNHNEDPHAGCPQLLNRIKEIKPKLVVCGHVHEGHGANHSLMPDTMIVNASICTLDYKPTNYPIMVYL